jgi:hypothetical protein
MLRCELIVQVSLSRDGSMAFQAVGSQVHA